MFSFLEFSLWFKIIGGFILINFVIALLGKLLLGARFALKDLKKKLVEKEKENKLKVQIKSGNQKKKIIKENTQPNKLEYEQINKKDDDD